MKYIQTYSPACRQDTTPSTFDRPIATSANIEPSNKRAKAPDSPQNKSIASLVEEDVYTAVETFLRDVDTATRSIVEDLQQKLKDGDIPAGTIERETRSASLLKKRLEDLVLSEMMQKERRTIMRVSDNAEADPKSEADGSTTNAIKNSGTVLTLYGGERSAKQLFSSLARSNARNMGLGEVALPNGITTTTVLPVHSLEEGERNPPTMGSMFAPPPNIRPLNPPQQASKHTTTRSSSVNWYNPAEASTTAKEDSVHTTFNKQTLSTGQWLTYNVVPSPEQLTSPGSKRRHRDRALSTGEPQSAINEETSAAHAQAKEEALFRSVYSSFAPPHDDFGAVVTADEKNRIWWTKYGEPQHQNLLDSRHNKIYPRDDQDETDVSSVPEIDEKLVEEAISNWEPQDDMMDTAQGNNASRKTKEMDDFIQEISELLEILDSHQRIRNLSQPMNSRALQGQKEQLASIPGDPTTPSVAEFDVYENLKSQLVEVIATLPPYILAKLDGDKLGALRFSPRIKIPGKDQKGTLEEDELSLKAKSAARPAAASSTYPAYGGSSALRSGYPSTTPAPQYAQRQSYGQSSAPKISGVASSYTAQFSGRPPSASHYPASNTRPSYGAQFSSQRATTSSSYTDRYANGVAQQYGHQQTPHAYGQYPNSYRPPMAQTASSYGQQYATPQARIPPASSPAAQAYRGSQSEYQQRAPPPPAYNYGAAQIGTTALSNSGHGSSFSGQAGAASQARPQLYHQHSSHYGSHSPAEAQTNGAGSSGQGNMSPDEQKVLMNRPKGQLAEEQQQQQQTRLGSGTPQPATGQTTQHNGTPAPQPNGVSV